MISLESAMWLMLFCLLFGLVFGVIYGRYTMLLDVQRGDFDKKDVPLDEEEE